MAKRINQSKSAEKPDPKHSITSSFELFLVGPNSLNDDDSIQDDEDIEIAKEIKNGENYDEQIEDKHIVPPNSPAEPILNVSRESSSNTPQTESEPLYPTPAEPVVPPRRNHQSINSSEYIDYRGSSFINTEVSVHTVPSTAVRTL